MGRFRVDIELANYRDLMKAAEGVLSFDQVRRLTIQGVVDSGAARLVLPKTVVDELGLPTIGKVGVRYADQHRPQRTKVKDVWLCLLDRDGVFSAIVEPKRKDALIGAIVLEELDLLPDCKGKALVPRDPDATITEVE